RSASGLATPPGSTRTSTSAAERSAVVRSTAWVPAGLRWSTRSTSPSSVLTRSAVCPASVTAPHGSVSSTRSIPSPATRKATVRASARASVRASWVSVMTRWSGEPPHPRNRTGAPVAPRTPIRHDAGMRRRDQIDRRGRRGRRRGGCGCSLLLLLILLVGLVVAAEFGARWYLSDRAEREASAELGAPVSVDFGRTPILWDLATTQAVDTVRLTSPGAETVPRIDVTGYSVRLVDGAILAATADGTATLTGAQ